MIPNIFADQAHAAATTREQRNAEISNEIEHVFDAACKRALELFGEGRPGRAAYVIARAWDRCNRIHAGRCPRG